MPDPSIDDPARNASYSAVWFSGKRFHRIARDRGGAHAHSARIAANIAARGRVSPLRGTRGESRLPGPPRTGSRQNDAPSSAGGIAEEVADEGESLLVTGGKWLAGQAISWAWDTYGPQLGLKYSVELDIANLRKQMLDQFEGIHDQISQLQAGISQTIASQKRVEDALAKMRSDAALARYSVEHDRLQAAIATLSTLSARTAQYYAENTDPAPPDSPEGKAAAQGLATLKNNLAQLIKDDNCPDIDALVGAIPASATGGTSLCMGINRQGLVQIAQGDAANNQFVSAADQIHKIDATGLRWLAIGWQDVALHVMAWKAAADDGAPVLTPDVIDATGKHLTDGLAAVAADRTGAYFGVRIPRSHVVGVTGFTGTVYGIGPISHVKDTEYAIAAPFVGARETSVGDGEFTRSSSVDPAAGSAINAAAYCEFLRPAIGASKDVAAAWNACLAAKTPTTALGPIGWPNPNKPGTRYAARDVPLPNFQVALSTGCRTFTLMSGTTGTPPNLGAPPPSAGRFLVWNPLAQVKGLSCDVFDATTAKTGINCALTDGATGPGSGIAMMTFTHPDGYLSFNVTKQWVIPAGPAQDWWGVGSAFPNICPSNLGPWKWYKQSDLFMKTEKPDKDAAFVLAVQAGGTLTPNAWPFPNGCASDRVQNCVEALTSAPVSGITMGGDKNWTVGDPDSGGYVVGALYQRGYRPNTYIPGTGP